MMPHRRRLLLAGLALLLVVTMVAGSAARPTVTVRADVTPQTHCVWYWDGLMLLWCYYCCDYYGCEVVYCGAIGP